MDSDLHDLRAVSLPPYALSYTLLIMLRVLFALFLFNLLLPVQAQSVQVVSSLSNDDWVAPGSVYTGRITIRNNSDALRQAEVTPSDYFFSSDGTVRYDPPGTVGRSNAQWITFSPSVVTLPPREAGVVDYQVRVPANTPCGAYWSTLFVQGIDPNDFDDRKRPAGSIRTKFRFSVQVATHIPGDCSRSLRMDGIEIMADEQGKRKLKVALSNAGEQFDRPALKVELYDASQQLVETLKGLPVRLYPGTSANTYLDASRVPPGRYQALLLLEGQSDDVTGAQVTLDL